MFSGIIEHIGSVEECVLREHAMALSLKTDFKDVELGESIAVNGVCLTVVQFTSEGLIDFDISGETLARTALGHLKPGKAVNLERAVSLNSRLSGHIVQGHVDNIGMLESCKKEGDSYHLRIFLPKDLRRYVVEKGSITVNGISLTINYISDDVKRDDIKRDDIKRDGQDGFEIGLMIIPHTWQHTDLSSLAIGDYLNIEVDVLAKYVENLMRFPKEEGATL